MHLKQRKRLMQFGFVVGIISAMGVAANAENYRASCYNQKGSLHCMYMEHVSEKVKEATNGKINLEIYYGGSLLPAMGSLTGTRDGVSDYSLITPAYQPSDMPWDNVMMDLSFLSDDQLVDCFTTAEIKFTNPLLLEEQAKFNLVYDGVVSMGLYNYQCKNKEIKTLADLKGTKLRCAGGAHTEWAKAVGAVPVAAPSSELYTGLQRGSIDCTMGTPLFLTDYFKLSEVVTSVTRLPMGSTNSGVFYFNKDFWKSLSNEERRIILDKSAESMGEIMTLWGRKIEETWELCRKENIALIEPDEAMTAKLNAYKENYVKNFSKDEMEKRKISDPTELVNTWNETSAKWRKLLSEIDRTDVAQVTALIKKEIFDKIDEKTFGMQ